MVDFVVGHTSSEHPWFLNSVNSIPPYEDYYIWANGTTLDNGTRMPPSNWVSGFSVCRTPQRGCKDCETEGPSCYL